MVLANKQDLGDAMPAPDVAKALGLRWGRTAPLN
jgi:signal recognition particle receptor subunit beta